MTTAYNTTRCLEYDYTLQKRFFLGRSQGLKTDLNTLLFCLHFSEQSKNGFSRRKMADPVLWHFMKHALGYFAKQVEFDKNRSGRKKNRYLIQTSCRIWWRKPALKTKTAASLLTTIVCSGLTFHVLKQVQVLPGNNIYY